MNRRGLEGRARRTLLWCAAVLCLSPIPGGWLVDHCPLYIRWPNLAIAVSSWEKASPRPDVLLLGSSRLGSFIRTAELARLTKELTGSDPPLCFNLTVPGVEPIALEFLTRRLLESRGAPPRLVVLETNADLLARDNVYFATVITQIMTAADIPKYFRDILLFHDGVSRLLSSRLTPFYRHRTDLLAWMAERVNTMVGQNESPIDETSLNRWHDAASNSALVMSDTEELQATLRRFRDRLQHYELAGSTPSAFEKMVARLHERGCVVVLVSPPLISAHRAFFNTAIQTQFQAFVQRLRRSYGCQFFDYRDRFPDTDFADNHHGNRAGSLKFTELLAEEVVAPEWRKLERKQKVSQP